jgi:hypothetical protein
VGLGQGTGTVKVGGVKWEGKRVSFEEAEPGAEADDGPAADAAAADGGDRLAAIGSCTALDALAAEQRQISGQATEQAAGGTRKRPTAGKATEVADVPVDSWEAAVKWRKIISAQLQTAQQQQLKLKQLQRQVVAAVLAKHGKLVSSKAAIKAAFVSRLGSSSKFVVDDGLVRLRS